MKLQDLKIIFFGTPEFAVESLEALLHEGADIAAVVTMPDKTGGRGHQVIESAVKRCAAGHNLPILQPEKLSAPDFVERLRNYAADLFIVIAFRMLPKVVWTMPPMGTFNLHASLLPQYRGAAPINRAIMNGEKESGVTTFLLKHEIDTGDILMQERVAIDDNEDVGSLYTRLMVVGARLTIDTVKMLAEGNARPIPQEQLLGGAEPTPAPKIFHQDCRIDWCCSAHDIHNLVRGLSPAPGAWCEFTTGGDMPTTTIKVLKTLIGTSRPLAPGQPSQEGKHIYVGTGDGVIELVTVQPAGKKAMPATAWFNGIHPRDGGHSPRML